MVVRFTIRQGQKYVVYFSSMVGFCFKALNGGIVMVNFYNKYINCAPNEMPKAALSQVAGKPFRFPGVFFKVSGGIACNILM